MSFVCFLSSPQAAILKTEAIFNRTSPLIGSFSSRGPNTIAVDILKVNLHNIYNNGYLYFSGLIKKCMVDYLQPDITAPGVEILAAYSPDGEPSEYDTRHVKYAVLSGTSMACPHVAGVASYVKTFYPKWSPSMIQSAIMTTGKKNKIVISCPQVTFLDSLLIWSLNKSLQHGR